MSSVFISYRREDSRASAGRLYETLRGAFGSDQIYKDVDDIPLGRDFRIEVAEAIARSAAMVVVIGPTWTSGGALNRPNDFVRIELEQALALGLTVFPVLVDGASMPSQSDLPPGLVSIAYLNALSLDHDTWDRDAEPLVDALHLLLGTTIPTGNRPDVPSAPPRPVVAPVAVGAPRRWRGIVLALAVAVLAVGAVFFVIRSQDTDDAAEVIADAPATGNTPEDPSTRNTSTEDTAPPEEPGCNIDVDHIGAFIWESPDLSSRQLKRVPDGRYSVLETEVASFGGRDQLWFHIEVDGQAGWIFDGILLTGKSSACP